MERIPGNVFDHLINDTVCIFRAESETVVSLKTPFPRAVWESVWPSG